MLDQANGRAAPSWLRCALDAALLPRFMPEVQQQQDSEAVFESSVRTGPGRAGLLERFEYDFYSGLDEQLHVSGAAESGVLLPAEPAESADDGLPAVYDEYDGESEQFFHDADGAELLLLCESAWDSSSEPSCYVIDNCCRL